MEQDDDVLVFGHVFAFPQPFLGHSLGSCVLHRFYFSAWTHFFLCILVFCGLKPAVVFFPLLFPTPHSF